MLRVPFESLREQFLGRGTFLVGQVLGGTEIRAQSADLPSERRAPRSRVTERTAWPYSGSAAVMPTAACSEGLFGRRTVPGGASGTPHAAISNRRLNIQL